VSMELCLRHGGRTLAVALAPDGDGFAATVDGVARRVRLLAGGPAGPTVEELVVEVDGRPRRVVVARTRDRVTVVLDGRTYGFELGDDTRADRAGGAGSGTVIAPMPGKVLQVLVAVGDTVEPGQALVVVEAMKMETTLAAEIAGRVKAVHAAPGAMADAGAVLVEIEPATV